MNATNPLVPARDWNAVAEGFRQATGTQNILCGYCVAADELTPPPVLVIMAGWSVCLPHVDTLKKWLNENPS